MHLIHRKTVLTDDRESTEIFIMGIPLFKHVVIDQTDHKPRSAGFNVYPSDNTGHFESEFEEDSD